jgi:hypothetical protein
LLAIYSRIEVVSGLNYWVAANFCIGIAIIFLFNKGFLLQRLLCLAAGLRCAVLLYHLFQLIFLKSTRQTKK